MTASEKTLSILYFASLGETLCTNSETLAVDNSVVSVSDLIALLAQRGENWQLLQDKTTKCAVNQTIASKDQPLNHNDEVAFFPPVTGG